MTAIQTQRFIEIGIEDLIPHPERANQMSKSGHRRLVRLIRQGGFYEPLIVRRVENQPGKYEILNGCHRLEALQELGINRVQCCVWQVDDDQARVLLATLNRISGKDDLTAKAKLIAKLHENCDIRDLVKILPQSRKTLEKLISISKRAIEAAAHPAPSNLSPPAEIPEPIVFILSTEQRNVVESAVAQAKKDSADSNPSRRRTESLVEICKTYLAGNSLES